MTYAHHAIVPIDHALDKATLGITKREDFAKAAMQSLLLNPNIVQLSDVLGEHEWQENIAEAAVKMADSLIAELNERENK